MTLNKLIIRMMNEIKLYVIIIENYPYRSLNKNLYINYHI